MLRPTLSRGSYCSSTLARNLTSRPATTLLQAAHTHALPATTSKSSLYHARLFHHTPARRIFETSEQVAIAVAGLATGFLLIRKVWRSHSNLMALVRPNSPPLSWVVTADPEVAGGVFSGIQAGLTLAKSRPAKFRVKALREFVFQLPHEIARLNKDAPKFKLEDMGPCPDWADMPAKQVAALPFNLQKDTKVFLYYPDGAEKATAAFLVINTELNVPDGTTSFKKTQDIKVLIFIAIRSWMDTYEKWMEISPEIIKNKIEPGNLPIIFCFQNKISGSLYDQKAETFHDAGTAMVVLDLMDQ